MTVLHLATGEVDLDRTLAVLGMLPGDPTVRIEPGRLVRATWTPDGPGTVEVTWHATGTAEVRTDGPGARWLADRAPALLGLLDDTTGFDPGGPVRDVWRRHRGMRVPRTGTVWHDVTWLVVQQRIRRTEAAQQWRALVRRYGEPAPDAERGLLVPPAPDRLARTAYHELQRLGIDRRRADALRTVATVAHRLHGLIDLPVAEARAALHTLRGIGPWTTSTMAAVTWGDADALIVGDSGIPSMVAWLVAREPRATDERMAQLLEPHRPHRYRVVQLAFAARVRPPRAPVRVDGSPPDR